jgi:hypothetical protein
METQGKWYFVKYEIESHDYYNRKKSTKSEVIFIKNGESIAKYVRKKCIKNSYYESCGLRGMPEGRSWLIKELSLLLPNGEKITGFVPHSLKNLIITKNKK